MVQDFPKNPSMKMFLFTLAFLSPLAAPAQTESPATPTAAPVSSPSPTPVKTEWEGKFGLGLTQANIQTGVGTNPTLFSVRYGLSSRFILEALVGGSAGTQVGADAFNNPLNDPYWSYSFGFGVKTMLAQPCEGLWAQFLTRLLYSVTSSQRSSSLDVTTDRIEFLSLAAGLGFEYFLPFAKSLSLESGVNLQFDNSWESFSDVPRNPLLAPRTATPSLWSMRVVSPGFNLTALSIHYYF